MLAQAGVAIGLAQSLAQNWPEGGTMVQMIVLGSVVFFEVIGPIAVRHGLINAGEVPVLTLLTKRAPENTYEGLHHVVEHFRKSLGVPIGHKLKSPEDILVKHVMRKNVETMCEDTPFQGILSTLSHSRYDRFPIVNRDQDFLGVIDYSDIRDLIFDKMLNQLVVAKDLVHPLPLVLHPDQTLGEALQILQKQKNITYLPVVSEEKPQKLVGMINQNDILATFRADQTQKGERH